MNILASLALSLTLAWNPVPEASGYKLYWGARGSGYTNSISASTNRATVLNLQDNVAYQFVATTIGTNGLESDYSAPALFLPPTNVLTIGVDILNSTNVNGPFVIIQHFDATPLTNPPAPNQFFASKMTINKTNISK